MASSNCEEKQVPISSHLQQDDNACLSAMLLCCSPIYTAVLNAALELNLFGIIAKACPRGVSASDIASQLPITQHPELPRKLDRMLCLLASHSLLTCSTRTNEHGRIERLYGLSHAGKYLVDDENTGSVAFLPTFASHRAMVDVFLNFKEVLFDGGSDIFKKVHGMPIYQCMQTDQALNHVFNKAMTNLGKVQMKKVLEKYSGFEGISLLVDVGGGVGQNLNMVRSKYPSIKGINFDLPQVIQNAPAYPGVEHITGDMFESVPEGDAMMLKVVSHNWSDEKCLKVLCNCYKALPENGKVIIVDYIMPENIQSSEADMFTSSIDNLMFITDGRERTQNEFEYLCKGSGFSKFKVVCHAFSALGVMEFYK